MSRNQLGPVSASVAADIMSALGLPGSNTVQTLVNAHLMKRRAEAQEMLLHELRNGYHGFVEAGGEDQDELLSVMIRFTRSVEEGIARDNLRLLAQIIAGLKKNRALQADNFARWSGILENLDRDQLLVVGAAYVFDRDTKLPPLYDDERNFWGPFLGHMEPRGFSRSELEMVCASLAQAGLFLGASAWGGMAYDVTERLRKLGKLANLEGHANGNSSGRTEFTP